MSRKSRPEFYCERSVTFTPDTREEHGDGHTLTGYAAVFEAPTRIASWEGIFDETISRGAFAKTLGERKPIMQFDHGHDSRVGNVPIGVFSDIREDEVGLFTSGRLFDNPVVEPVRQAIEAGAISGMSFRFQVVRDEWFDKNGVRITKRSELEQLLWEPGDRGPLKRNIKEVKLSEAGPVVFPAYTQTSVGVRAHDEAPGELTRESVVDFYTRSFPTEELPEERADAVETEEVVDTSEERSDEEPEDAVEPERADTSEGHEEVREDLDEEAATEQPDEAERKESVQMTLEEMRNRLAEIEERQTADEFRSETLDGENQTEWDGLEAERAKIESDITKAEARQARLAELAKGGAVERGTPSVHIKKSEQELYDLGELRAASFGGADFLRKVEDNAKRAVEACTPGVERKQRDEARERAMELLEEKDNSSRDLAKRFLLTGSREYAEAFGKVLRYGSDAMCTNEERAALIRAQELGTDGGGGYAVPFQLDPSVILTSAGVVNPIRQLARVEQIVGKEWQGVTSAGVTVVRGSETTTAPDSSFTIDQPVVRTNRVQGFVPFSIEIDLTWGALQSEITRMLVDAKEREEDIFVTGDGVTGTQAGGVVGSLGAGENVNATAAGAFDVEDVYRLEESLDPRWERNASFLAHKAIYNKIRQFDTAGGANLWARLGDGTPGRLLDYPTHRSSAMDSTHAVGDRFLLFGDFKQFLIVDRIGMNIELVPHVFDAANANRPTGKRGVYAVWMNNSKILVEDAFKVLLGLA